MCVHNKHLGHHDNMRNSLVVSVLTNQHACAGSEEVCYGNCVLKLSTLSLAEDYLISCLQANRLSLLEKLITMVTKSTEKNSCKRRGGIQKKSFPQLFLVILLGSSAAMTA